MADLEAIARRFYDEVMSQGDLALIDEVVSDDFVDHEEFPGISNDKQGIKDFVNDFRAAFPDMSVEILAMVTDGDEVWVHALMRGTHQGELMGTPATGRSVEMPMFDRVRFAGDQVVEHWGITDGAAMMEQLGVLPEM